VTLPYRQGNRWDGVLNGINFRLNRKVETPYRKFYARSLLELQQLLAQGREQFTSRSDIRPLFQTSWAAGAQWQKPLLSEQSIDSYYRSEGFDLVTEPGNVIPQPDWSTLTISPAGDDIYSVPRTLQVDHENIYYATSDAINDSGLKKYNGSTWADLTNDFGSTDVIRAMCWDANLATVFGVDANGVIRYVTPDSAGGSVIATSETPYTGTNIFTHFGRLFYYNGEKLMEIEDPLGTPAVTTIYNDTMGPDAANNISEIAPGPIGFGSVRLAISSSEGIWIVKNVYQEGQVVAFVTRVDRTNDGIDVGVPVATLPSNTMVLDITNHLGSLVLSASSDLIEVYENYIADAGFFRVVFYHLTNNSLGTIGSPYGGIPSSTLAETEIKDSPYTFIGSDRELLYIGGRNEIWVYDAVRGGLHKWLETNENNNGTFLSMVFTIDSSDNKYQQVSHYINTNVYRIPILDEGGNTITHTLESNYFDGNLPSEEKSVIAVTLMTSGIKTNETWTVGLEADDAGSFTTKATLDTDGDKTVKQEFASAVTGYRFRYKITYTASADVTAPSRLKGIVFHMVQGEMVLAWQLVIDGSHIENVENVKQEPDQVFDNWSTIGGDNTIVTFVDEFKPTASTHDVRIQQVSIDKSNPNIVDRANVVIYEHNLDNDEE
jgi:hypothetical protein